MKTVNDYIHLLGQDIWKELTAPTSPSAMNPKAPFRLIDDSETIVIRGFYSDIGKVHATVDSDHRETKLISLDEMEQSALGEAAVARLKAVRDKPAPVAKKSKIPGLVSLLALIFACTFGAFQLGNYAAIGNTEVVDQFRITYAHSSERNAMCGEERGYFFYLDKETTFGWESAHRCADTRAPLEQTIDRIAKNKDSFYNVVETVGKQTEVVKINER